MDTHRAARLLMLAAPTVPRDLLEHTVHEPGPRGQFAAAALCRDDIPADLVDPLRTAALAKATEPRVRCQVISRAAVLSWHAGMDPDRVWAAVAEDAAGERANDVTGLAILRIMRDTGTDPALLDALLETGDLRLLSAAVIVADPTVGLAALARWDQLRQDAPGDTTLADASRRACDGLAGLYRSDVAALAGALATVRTTDLVLAVLSCTAAHPALADIAAQQVLVPTLAGALKGASLLGDAEMLVREYGEYWTASGARALLEAAATARPPRSKAGRLVRSLAVKTATIRLTHHEWVASLGLAEGARVDLNADRGLHDPSAADLGAYLLSCVAPGPNRWAHADAVTASLTTPTSVGALGALLTAGTL